MITSIIVCFSYTKSDLHALNPRHVKTDARKVLTYLIGTLKIPLTNIIFITDILPDSYKIEELNVNFQEKIIQYLGNPNIHKNLNYYPLRWLEEICKEYNLNKNNILDSTLPILRTSSIIEYVYLFTKFYLINGKEHYLNLIRDCFNSLSINSKLIFYFTGHAYKTENTSKISLVVPDKQLQSASYIPSSTIVALLQSIHESIDVVYIFDCCYAEIFLIAQNGYRFGKNGKLFAVSETSNISSNKFFIGSTLKNQTCGFYNDDTIDDGSLFTHFLFKYLQIAKSRFLLELYKNVEIQIEKYRYNQSKGMQNMIIGNGASKLAAPCPTPQIIMEFPLWFCQLN